MTPASQKIDSIGIVGGGTAGYLAALTLRTMLPLVRVTVVESSRIPVIGVGESTTPMMIELLHRVLGFDVSDLYAAVQPTWKLGTKLEWGRREIPSFNVPFGNIDLRKLRYHQAYPNRYSLHSLLMDQRRSIVFATGEQTGHRVLGGPLPYAYHIDNKLLLNFLRGKIRERGIEHLDAEISEVRTTPEHHEIASLHTTDGRTLRYDLYLDCSGFRSILLGTALRCPFVSFHSSLPTDRAVIGIADHGGEIKPYTLATTLRHGWRWTIPLRSEDHLGYVYASRFCSDDEAAAELRAATPNLQSVDEKIVKFRAGRHAQFWRGNVVGIGNAYAFVEPLHSTGLHMSVTEVLRLAEALRDQTEPAVARDNLNQTINARWDMLRWYLALHFPYHQQHDSAFWHHCRSELDLAGAEEYLEVYRRSGPIMEQPGHPLLERLNQDAVFSAANFDIVLMLLGVKPGGETALSAAEKQSYEQEWRINQVLLQKSLRQAEALKIVEDHPHLLNFSRWTG